MYNDLTFALWAYTDAVDSEPAMADADSLYRFQELVQQLVTLETNASRVLAGSKARGTRLDAIQRDIVGQEGQVRADGQDPGATMAIDIPAVLGTSVGSNQLAADGFSLSEFLHLELFEDGTGQPLTESIYMDQTMVWKDTLPLTALLLASIAFSIVWTMVIGERPNHRSST